MFSQFRVLLLTAKETPGPCRRLIGQTAEVHARVSVTDNGLGLAGGNP